MMRIEVKDGEEVLDKVAAETRRAGITEAVIMSIIGAVDECCVSTMPKGDASTDILREYAEPLEMFGTGEVRNGRPHIHANFGTEDGTAVAGHLHWARPHKWFVNVYLCPL
jgi:predicted DNA-binding protein with PD1-like motif